MAHKPATLILGLALLLALGLRAEAQSAAAQDPTGDLPAGPGGVVGVFPPVFPPPPPEAAAMSLQSAVPQSEVARSAPLINTAARL